MAKRIEEKKKKTSGKMIFGVILAVGSAVAAFVASKFLAKKGEIAQSASDEFDEMDMDVDMAENNYITLDNDLEATEEETETTETLETADVEVEEEVVDEMVEELIADSDETQVANEDDDTKCVRD